MISENRDEAWPRYDQTPSALCLGDPVARDRYVVIVNPA